MKSICVNTFFQYSLLLVTWQGLVVGSLRVWSHFQCHLGCRSGRYSFLCRILGRSRMSRTKWQSTAILNLAIVPNMWPLISSMEPSALSVGFSLGSLSSLYFIESCDDQSTLLYYLTVDPSRRFIFSLRCLILNPPRCIDKLLPRQASYWNRFSRCDS